MADLPVRLNLRAIEAFGRSSAVGRELIRRAQPVQQAAKGYAPVSPAGSHGRPSGYLRSSIRIQPGQDTQGLYVDVTSPAATPTGQPYGLFQEIGTRRMAAQPHLRPALDDEFPGASPVRAARYPRKARSRRAGRGRR